MGFNSEFKGLIGRGAEGRLLYLVVAYYMHNPGVVLSGFLI